jgi:hypothetical protein
MAAAAGAFGAATDTTKPSILHVVADDLGYFDLGYKNERTHSPTIDALAAGGVRLTDYYVMVVCSCAWTARPYVVVAVVVVETHYNRYLTL